MDLWLDHVNKHSKVGNHSYIQVRGENHLNMLYQLIIYLNFITQFTLSFLTFHTSPFLVLGKDTCGYSTLERLKHAR